MKNYFDEVRPFVEALSTRYDAFFDLLRAGELVAAGVSRDQRALPVDPSLWSRDDFLIDLKCGDLLQDCDKVSYF